jgi:ferredoxin
VPGPVLAAVAAGPAIGGRLALSRRLRVDPIRCDGHGLCAELFPERVQRDDWGYPIVSPAPIEEYLLPLARKAVDACPVLALRLESEPRA